jgi:glucose/arabinose dehydrogenase
MVTESMHINRKKIIKVLLFILMVIGLFMLGANQYRMKWWPFEDGFESLSIDEILPDQSARIGSVFGTENLRVYPLPIDDEFPSGPFEILGNKRFLFISKCGEAYFAALDDNEIERTQAPQRLSKSDDDDDDAKPLVYCQGSSGVKDSLRVNNSLYVSYIVWDDMQNGARLAVSEFTLDVVNSRLIYKRDIFVSNPAIKEPFLGMQAGGKLALGESDDTVYLAIGDFGKPQGVQDASTSLGKLMKINTKAGTVSLYASGLRSPSGGLYFDHEAGELWETEHGPRGGDEINLIREGSNYGWPLVSYGTMYERDGNGDYYGNSYNGHEGYEKPIFTFVPSIGVGSIARYPKSGRNAYWENSFFVAGMATTSLYHMKKEGHRLVYAEPVLSGYRIRVVKIDADGRFYLKTDHNQLLISE